MPNFFTLTRKAAPDAGPVPFAKIDEEMCAYFGVPVHPEYWHHHWYDVIGLSLATGKTLLYLLETARADRAKQAKRRPGDDFSEKWETHYIEVLEWLEANFVANSWARIGR